MKTPSTKPFQGHNLFEPLLLYAVTKNEKIFWAFYADNKRLGDKQPKHKKKYFETGPRLVTPNPITFFSLIKSYFSISVKMDATV